MNLCTDGVVMNEVQAFWGEEKSSLNFGVQTLVFSIDKNPKFRMLKVWGV